MNGDVIIPWPCLAATTAQPHKSMSSVDNVKQQKTFADALANVCDIPVSQFPQPCVKGQEIAIMIPENEYLAGMDGCKNNLHGRIIWPKGSTPLKIDELRAKLATLWNSLGRWGMVSLGKGFYEFYFSSVEDVRRVRSVASWSLNPGYLKLFTWTNDFNLNAQHHTTAQVWIRISGLAQEYWRKNIIFAIVSSIGTPIYVDANTSKSVFERSFGHYARILVDVDLSVQLRYQLLVERKGFAFFVEIEYENLPDFCDYCKHIGHNNANCKQNKTVETEARDMGKKVSKSRKEFIQVRDNRQNQPRQQPVNNETASGSEAQPDANEPNKEDVVNVNHISQTGNEDQELVNGNENLRITQEVPEFVPDTPISDKLTDEAIETIEHDFNVNDDNPNIPKVVHQDVQILKFNPADMAEEQRNNQEGELALDNTDDQPFEIVLTKSQKKTKKRQE
ncbi:uncharacterized protein LOC123922559 [Trifolium pratense]|uniref:uncharacterized protein LOC123922559 n=1 Tax=Trifolium pratense TaxID=57577 RepID=UPI001E697A4B|nr:uncharacterized protein LOC123922559 [Trifolium pratense]